MSRALKDYNSPDWHSLFYYDTTSKTGLRWKVDRYCGRKLSTLSRRMGDTAGYISHNKKSGGKYATVEVNECSYQTHRIIWIMLNGCIDNELVIDHIDGDGLNNTIDNLRVVKQELNRRNTSIHKNNSTKVTGVCFKVSGNLVYVEAIWNENKKQYHKRFAVHKYGLLPAFALACKHREIQIARLNAIGYGYTENHGKCIKEKT